MASVRYIVAGVDEAVGFYRDNLDFKVDMHNPGKFAALLREDLTLYLSAHASFRGDISDGGAGRAILLEDPSGNVVELFEFRKH